MKTFFKISKIFVIGFAILLIGPLVKVCFKDGAEGPYHPKYHKTLPIDTTKAVIEVYGADAGRWQSSFSMHTWVALKKRNEEQFTIYEVVRERVTQGLPVVNIWKGNPDRPWVGHAPRRLFYLEGENAEKSIPLIEQAIEDYPYKKRYVVWPGPNCNTFTAYVARSVPNLGIVLPPNAIGKDFLPAKSFFTRAPSGTGYQCSLFGILGITVALKEGLEMNCLGLSFGVALYHPGLLVPGVGKIAFSGAP
ncbi:MAG: DUF3750 domain-containing protein [Simkania sp.]|nr:DUF3750 domain-containing protein [Simkania sp.]